MAKEQVSGERFLPHRAVMSGRFVSEPVASDVAALELAFLRLRTRWGLPLHENQLEAIKRH